MRDRDRRPPLGQPLERLLDEPLGLRVERRGRLVEHQDRRVPQHGARDRHALLLAAREAVAALADDGLVAVGKRGDQLVDLRGPRRLLDLLVGGVGLREAEVLAHGRVEEIGLLRDDADRRGERLEGQLANVDPVDRDRALGRVVEPRDEVAARRLAGAGLAHERGLGAGRAPRTRRPSASRRRRRSGSRRGRRRRRRAGARASACPRRCRSAGRGSRRCGRTAPASSAPRSGRRAGCRSGRTAASAAS